MVRGWCQKHYQRLRKHGDPDYLARDHVQPDCSIGDCPEPTVARGWCSKHYQHWRKYGDPLAPKSSPMRNGSKPSLFVAIGQRFGRWVVMGPEARTPSGHRGAPVKCSCPLGIEKIATLDSLFSGKSLSCGCLQREQTAQRNQGVTGEDHPAFKHGLTDHPLFNAWKGMLRRCDNPASKDWPNYGGRGITVCDAWHDPAVFVSWVDEHLGPRPDGMSLDRWPDNDGNYEPGNIRWATAKQQNWNRRKQRRRRWHCVCGNRNPMRAKFCFECGVPLTR
jgi:hypothetical protein